MGNKASATFSFGLLECRKNGPCIAAYLCPMIWAICGHHLTRQSTKSPNGTRPPGPCEGETSNSNGVGCIRRSMTVGSSVASGGGLHPKRGAMILSAFTTKFEQEAPQGHSGRIAVLRFRLRIPSQCQSSGPQSTSPRCRHVGCVWVYSILFIDTCQKIDQHVRSRKGRQGW